MKYSISKTATDLCQLLFIIRFHSVIRILPGEEATAESQKTLTSYCTSKLQIIIFIKIAFNFQYCIRN